jgi:hypothetical protein
MMANMHRLTYLEMKHYKNKHYRDPYERHA